MNDRIIKIRKQILEKVTLSKEEKEKIALGSLSPKKTEAYTKMMNHYNEQREKLLSKNFIIDEFKTKPPFFDQISLSWKIILVVEKEITEQEFENLYKKEIEKHDEIFKNIDGMFEKVDQELNKVFEAFDKHVQPVMDNALNEIDKIFDLFKEHNSKKKDKV